MKNYNKLNILKCPPLPEKALAFSQMSCSSHATNNGPFYTPFSAVFFPSFSLFESLLFEKAPENNANVWSRFPKCKKLVKFQKEHKHV